MTIFSSARALRWSPEKHLRRGREGEERKRKKERVSLQPLCDFDGSAVSFNIEYRTKRLIFRDTTDVPRGNNLESVYIYIYRSRCLRRVELHGYRLARDQVNFHARMHVEWSV